MRFALRALENSLATVAPSTLRRTRIPVSVRLAFHRAIARQRRFAVGWAVKIFLTAAQLHHRCSKRVGRGKKADGSGPQARASASQGRRIAG